MPRSNTLSVNIPAIFAVVISFLLVGAGSIDPFRALLVTKPPQEAKAPAFQLPTPDGHMIHSNELLGKVVLLNFWATWCGPCKEEMPALNQLRQQFKAKQFQMFAVTADVHPHAIAQFWERLRLSIPVLFDEEEELSQVLMVRSLPTTILIGPKGLIRGRTMGPRDWNSPEAIALITQLMKSS